MSKKKPRLDSAELITWQQIDANRPKIEILITPELERAFMEFHEHCLKDPEYRKHYTDAEYKREMVIIRIRKLMDYK